MCPKSYFLSNVYCNNNIYVETGKIKFGKNSDKLITTGIGSCIAFTAYDPILKIGAMAHIMLPNYAPKNLKNPKYKYRYAGTAVEKILYCFNKTGSKIADLEICLAGGGNVLKKKNDIICQANIDYILTLSKIKKLNVICTDLGGFERRALTFDIRNEIIYLTVGDDTKKILWKYHSDRISLQRVAPA